ncbi:hypothetical protein RXV94_02540 [Yeosuana sp. MJ-SS3]|uniref:Porin n=1 Tax=Gilvirhabdus luticola TaxID=3079858 RepID=A0ABU3U3N8_9FLAO|nr:hypothetical protein [Yeosuana sp. MJ-SS3]MDU8885022.1 hypothetical protein [Yeosuana sp. MJ-SS3]
MKKNIKYIIILFLSVIGYSQNNSDGSSLYHNFEMDIEFEYRYFYNSPSFYGQKSNYPSLAFYPNYNLEWNKGYETINFEGFYRLDIDKERTHWDIRELYYQKASSNWELSLGIKKVFWGVTESVHLVDIINQTDAVESFDGEQKLGQPMVQFSLNMDFGTIDVFYLPYHRKRTFPGEKGRIRFPIVIDSDNISYESSAQEWHQGFAVRYSNSFNNVDLGVSFFKGTGREPYFEFTNEGISNAIYPQINQIGLDIQYTQNAFLWKLESIYRPSNFQSFFALAAGLEYTIGNIRSTGVDLGLIGEYLYDERDELALSAMQNDIFLGARIALNDVQDTSILMGGILDLESSSTIFSLEASRRLGSSFKIELEGRFFQNISKNDLILNNFKSDSFIGVSLIKYF